eukprot:1211471-Lingulodinium_polyedra.AAC.1
MAVARPLRGRRMVVAWPLRGCCMAVVWPLRGRRVAVADVPRVRTRLRFSVTEQTRGMQLPSR